MPNKTCAGSLPAEWYRDPGRRRDGETRPPTAERPGVSRSCRGESRQARISSSVRAHRMAGSATRTTCGSRADPELLGMPYTLLEKLLFERGGEATVITDR